MMDIVEKVYDKSPLLFQNAMCTLSGYARNRTRYGNTYKEYLLFCRQFDDFSIEEKIKYQQDELISFIRFAYNHSKFYHDLYKDINISELHSVEDLRMLPIVDKEMLRANISDVYTVSRSKAVEGHTGGTTGKSLVVYYTPEDFMKRMAILDHFKERVGFHHLYMRRATFNGKHIVPPGQKKKVFWRYNMSCKQMIYSSFHLTEENMGYYVESINQFKPQAIDGFFTCMCELAGYIERHNLNLDFKPIALFPTSETLTRAGREQLERVFRCKVYDQYASSEGAPFITECSNNVKHIEMASGVFEHFDGGGDEILVTSFTTHGTPLIRYRIGDAILLNDIRCNCGLNAPTVREIVGRQLDFLYTAEGAKINAGNVSNLFKNMPNVLIRAQLIQERLGEVTAILETDKTLYKPEYDNLLIEEFHHKFGYSTKLTIHHVDEIPREKSGKFRMIKNSVIL